MSIVWKHIALPAALVSAICAIVACSNSESFEDPASIAWQPEEDPCSADEDGDIVYKSQNGEFLKCEDKKQVHVDVDVKPLDSLDFPTDTAVASSDTIPEIDLPECIDGDKNCINKINNPTTYTSYLPLNDSEYPYAGLPRIVIETDGFQEIKDRETEIPAKLQIYGKNSAKSEVMELTIRGRGNTSWDLPKKSYKIEFLMKQAILGMQQNKDWALIANYADKTLIKNKITYTLGDMLNLPYSPRSEFIELFINREYLGIYQFTETIKNGKNRVNTYNKNSSFLVEIDMKYKNSETVLFSNSGRSFKIHSPQKASLTSLENLQEHLNFIEECLKTNCYKKNNSLDSIFALNEYIAYYWIQEFSRNVDGSFKTSVYFSWENGKPISMGPLWDFDIAYGGWKDLKGYQNWYTRNYYWNTNLFKDSSFKVLVNEFWLTNNQKFIDILDTINTYKEMLTPATKNNFKRWPILQSTENVFHLYAYSSYEEAISALSNWIANRTTWINENLN